MTGSCWRLLAASLIFVVSAFLLGQDAPTARSPYLAPARDPNLAPMGGSPPNTPVLPPLSPFPPLRYPVGRHTVAPGTVALQQMTRAAGIIFSGSVTSILRIPSSSGLHAASTTVTFRVEHAIRGTSPGQNLTIQEWAGLWPRGERYRIGERVLLFLYAPSKLGLTSPVAGVSGRFAMDSQGKILLGEQHVRSFAQDPILGGKTVVPYTDFELAVSRASRTE
jgi:hypothetical protein